MVSTPKFSVDVSDDFYSRHPVLMTIPGLQQAALRQHDGGFWTRVAFTLSLNLNLNDVTGT